MYGLSTVARQSPVSGCKSRTVAFIRSSTQTPVICRGFLFAAPRGCGSSANPLTDLQEQRDQFALAMRVRLGKDGFQLIARRLPGNLQTPGRRSREKRCAQCEAGELRFELATELASHGP